MLIDEEFDAYASPLLSQAEYQTMKNYRAHGQVSVYDHSLFVAERSYLYGKKHHLDLDYKSLVRGALLHDYRTNEIWKLNSCIKEYNSLLFYIYIKPR